MIRKKYEVLVNYKKENAFTTYAKINKHMIVSKLAYMKENSDIDNYKEFFYTTDYALALRKSQGLLKKNHKSINYKDAKILAKFLSDSAKILPREITQIKANQQRSISKAIRRARQLLILPFVRPIEFVEDDEPESFYDY